MGGAPPTEVAPSLRNWSSPAMAKPVYQASSRWVSSPSTAPSAARGAPAIAGRGGPCLPAAAKTRRQPVPVGDRCRAGTRWCWWNRMARGSQPSLHRSERCQRIVEDGHGTAIGQCVVDHPLSCSAISRVQDRLTRQLVEQGKWARWSTNAIEQLERHQRHGRHWMRVGEFWPPQRAELYHRRCVADHRQGERCHVAKQAGHADQGNRW